MPPPGAGQAAAAMLRSSQPLPPEALLAALVNGLAASGQPLVILLDDYHSIESPPIRQALAQFLERLPPHGRLVIATRADPPLPLHRLRARGELAELRAADLRFNTEEVAAFLNDAMGLWLSPTDVAALEARTEG